MPKNIVSIIADHRSTLSRILEQWTRTNIQVADAWRGVDDAPWWYNERASLSLLAGAIWQCGGIAFEEFSFEKSFIRVNDTLHRAYTGRCDMFFEVGVREFNVEAKFGQSAATSERADPARRIKGFMKVARQAAGRLPPGHQRRLAITFILPYFTRKFDGNESAMIRRWMEKTAKINCSAKAWVFPASSRNLATDDGFYYPGAAIFIEEVKRRTREH